MTKHWKIWSGRQGIKSRNLILKWQLDFHRTLVYNTHRTYLKKKIRVQGKARNSEKAEHTRSM
jgi:hypothetical protein